MNKSSVKKVKVSGVLKNEFYTLVEGYTTHEQEILKRYLQQTKDEGLMSSTHRKVTSKVLFTKDRTPIKPRLTFSFEGLGGQGYTKQMTEFKTEYMNTIKPLFDELVETKCDTHTKKIPNPTKEVK